MGLSALLCDVGFPGRSKGYVLGASEGSHMVDMGLLVTEWVKR